MCAPSPTRKRVRGRNLVLAGVGRSAYPSRAKLNEGEARSKARDKLKREAQEHEEC